MLDMERANQLLASVEPSLAELMGPAVWWIAGLAILLGAAWGVGEWISRRGK